MLDVLKIKPFNNSSRHHVKFSKFLLAKNLNFINQLRVKKNSSFGRDSSGHISSWHKQRGAKKLYRPFVALNKPSIYLNLFTAYDPNRTAFSSVVFDLYNKKFSNYPLTNSVCPGSIIHVRRSVSKYRLGFRMQLKYLPTGSIINNLGNASGTKISYIKSAGSVGQIIQVYKDSAKIKLPSGHLIDIPSHRYATLGVVSNPKHGLLSKGKAGRNRNLGRRPIVRGIAMNPVDHPHGGRTNGGQPSSTPWGLPTKGGFYLKRRSKKKLKK